MSESHPATSRELVITRDIPLPAERLYAGWTQPELLTQWFTPRPWTTVFARLDVRAGGENYVVMRSPEGQEFPNSGVYLEVVPHRKLVFTNAYTSAWEPSDHPFMTAIITFDDLGGGRTRYTARVLHWTVADREKHEAMGFYPGWNQALDQLIEVLQKNSQP